MSLHRDIIRSGEAVIHTAGLIGSHQRKDDVTYLSIGGQYRDVAWQQFPDKTLVLLLIARPLSGAVWGI